MRTPFAAASCSVLALSSAFAADVPPGAADKSIDPNIEKVEVRGARAYDERRQDTATKIVVSSEDIVRYGDSTVGEVLKRLPGVTIGGVQGRGGEIRMRGLGSGYTQIMLNGEPSPPGFSLDSLSPDMIERIEIMRAATAEFSTQAIAGAINIVLKKAVQTGQRELKVGLGSDHGLLSANTSLQISDRHGPLSYSVTGTLIRSRFDRPSQVEDSGVDAAGRQTLLRETTQNNTGTFEGVNLTPRLNWTFGEGNTLTSQTFINNNRVQAVGNERIATLAGPAPRYAADDWQFHSNTNMLRSDLNWTRKLAEGAKLDAKFGINYNKREQSIDHQSLDAANVFILGRNITSGATDRGFSFSGKYSTPIIADHALVTGWDGGYSVRGEDRIQRDIILPGQTPENLDEIYEAQVRRLAVFVQDEWSVTQRWSVYAGLRWEGLDTRSGGNVLDAVHNRSTVLSPLFQTLWKLPDSKNDQVRFGLTRTYKAPSTSSLIPRRFVANNNSATSPDTQGNPNLRPELAWGLDLAFEHYLPDGGLLSASTYVRRIDDVMRRRLSQIDGIWISMPVNDGQAQTRGIELEAKLPLRSVFKTAPAIELRANLSRNWSTIDTVPGPNNRLDQQTPFSANLGLDYKMGGMPLTLGGNMSFQNGGPVRLSLNQTAYTTPKRVLDMYGLWKFDTRTQLRISFSNLLHQDNVAQSGYFDDAGSLRTTTITPTTTVVRAMLEQKF